MASTRRGDILFHAAKLFSERGVAGTTVRDIADEVGILSGSLYHYFGSKDAIAFEIVIVFIDDLNERYQAALVPGLTGRERLDRIVSISFDAALDHPYATEIYQNESVLAPQPAESRIATAVRRAHGFWADTIAQGVDSGEFRADLDPQHFHRMLREAVWSTVRLNRPTLTRDADRLRRDLIAVFLDGFAGGGAAPAGDGRSGATAESGAPPSTGGADDVDSSEIAVLRRDVSELKDAIRDLRRIAQG